MVTKFIICFFTSFYIKNTADIKARMIIRSVSAVWLYASNTKDSLIATLHTLPSSNYYFTTYFLPLMMFTPFCGAERR